MCVWSQRTVRVGAVVGAWRLVVEVCFLLRRRGSGSRLGFLRRLGPFRILLLGRIDGDVLCLRDVIRIRGFGVGEVLVKDTVRFAIESSDTSRLLLPVCPHVGVIVVFVSPRTLLLPSPLSSFLEEFLIHVLPSTRYHTPSTQPRGPCRPTQGGAIRPLTPQDRRLVVIPIAFAELKAAIFGPEEEPYPAEDEKNADESEESKEAAVVDVVRINGAGTGLVCCACASCYVSCSKV